MPKVIGVKFRTSPRMYYFAPADDEEYVKNTKVVVETQRGVELATVIMPCAEVEEDKLVAPLKPVLRKADEKDLEAEKADLDQKQSIIATAKQKVAERGLDMKIVDCEFTVDHSKLVLYFTAEQRVDFRELVRDLASAFHMRIDLRQIGAREECKLIGSLGACGMPCCCGRFESDAEHVSIKMAKNQNLALTPNKINGMCGRLLCCLAYENKNYEDVIRRSPKHGATVTCPDGRRGTVVSVTPLTEKVRVRVGDDESFEFCEYDLNELGAERRDNAENASGNAEQAHGKKPQRVGDNNRDNNDRENGGRDNNKRGKNKFNKKQGGKNNDRNGADGDGKVDASAKPSGADKSGEPQERHGGKNNRNRNFRRNKNRNRENGNRSNNGGD